MCPLRPGQHSYVFIIPDGRGAQPCLVRHFANGQPRFVQHSSSPLLTSSVLEIVHSFSRGTQVVFPLMNVSTRYKKKEVFLMPDTQQEEGGVALACLLTGEDLEAQVRSFDRSWLRINRCRSLRTATPSSFQ